MYRVTNSGKLFSDELTNWLIDEAGFNQSKCQMSIYYKYAPDGSRLVLLSYVDDWVYWYTSEEPVKWFLYTHGNILHFNFLGYPHRFISIRISQFKDHYISVYQVRYDTYVVANYLDTNTIK